MRITVKFFAILRDKAGASETVVDLPPSATVADAKVALLTNFPSLTQYIPKIAFAINCEYAQPNQTLHDGDELALIPAVSGGQDSDDWIELSPNDLNVSDATAFVGAPAAGGIALFLGVTRAEKSLSALDYQAYDPMALKQLHALAQSARQRWPIIKLALLHRTGRVAVGQPSVLIAVSTPHRAEAFEACRWLIDSLKADVAIWKKEVWSDGSGDWVHPS